MNNALFLARRSGNGYWRPIGRLERSSTGYRFVYTHGVHKVEPFVAFPEMPDIDQVYDSEELFPIFANRLLSKSRPEYEAYLKWGGFDPDNPPDPIAILGVTEGLRATDNLELFPCPSLDGNGCYVNKFFLHGIRHMPESAVNRIDQLQPGEPLVPMFDDFNSTDSDAVAVRTSDVSGRYMIGYVPRYLAREVRQLCQLCNPDKFSITVERVNSNAPYQQRLLCRMRSCWPTGFDPLADEDFQPIPVGACLPSTENAR